MLPLTTRVALCSFGTSDPVYTCRAKGEDVGHRVCGFDFSRGGGGGGAKSLPPCFLVANGGQPTACTPALWWLKFGATEVVAGGGGGYLSLSATWRVADSWTCLSACLSDTWTQ